MDLATHQRKLLGLFRSTYDARTDDDPYLLQVAESKNLEEARRNITLWRIYVLERSCALTVNLLKQRHFLEEALRIFMMRQNISPFRETQAPAFLQGLTDHQDSLVASVAQFELALMRVRQGDPGFHIVSWTVEPHGVLTSLARDFPLEENPPEGDYQILISRDLPGLFQIASGQAE